jgi:hypothetical protein
LHCMPSPVWQHIVPLAQKHDIRGPFSSLPAPQKPAKLHDLAALLFFGVTF